MLLVGEFEVNASAQAALRRIAQWPWIDFPASRLRGGAPPLSPPSINYFFI